MSFHFLLKFLDELNKCMLAAGFVQLHESSLWDDQVEGAKELSAGSEIVALFVASV